jgi:hypothetical protein
VVYFSFVILRIFFGFGIVIAQGNKCVLTHNRDMLGSRNAALGGEMSDLVQRARSSPWDEIPLCLQMADEIERLLARIGDPQADTPANAYWVERYKSLRTSVERLRAALNIDLDACAKPTPEQIEQMETGFGAIFTPRMALELGMKTAIGNVKRARAALERE